MPLALTHDVFFNCGQTAAHMLHSVHMLHSSIKHGWLAKKISYSTDLQLVAFLIRSLSKIAENIFTLMKYAYPREVLMRIRYYRYIVINVKWNETTEYIIEISRFNDQ